MNIEELHLKEKSYYILNYIHISDNEQCYQLNYAVKGTCYLLMKHILQLTIDCGPMKDKTVEL